MIGRHECECAEGTDLAGAIGIGLNEAITALEESFYDLTDDQAAAFPVAGRNNVAWIVMHCLQNLDHYANTAPTNDRDVPVRALRHEERYDLWEAPEDQRPKRGDGFSGVRQMLDDLRAVRDKALKVLDDAGPTNLTRQTQLGPSSRTVVADSYMRTIWHTMSHVRQVWALRGVMGLVDGGQAWPRQHWA